jgi:hypothetical protein
MESYPSLDY